MASKTEIYRRQVAMAVGVDLRITFEEVLHKLSSYTDLIDAWGASNQPFTNTAQVVAGEIREAERLAKEEAPCD